MLGILPCAFEYPGRWHLGQLSCSYFLFLAKSNKDISVSKTCHCSVCPLAKQTRPPFSLSPFSTCPS